MTTTRKTEEPGGLVPASTPYSRGRPRPDAWLLPALLVFVLLSGFAALVYQILWLRLLALVFGVTVWAASTVLASFMGGLALGSFAAARFGDRARVPLRWYGLVELGIGASALATPMALDGVERAFVALAPATGGDLVALTVLRVAISFAVLIVPTALMGATLPLVTRAALTHGAALGTRVSLLYGTNTLGAIAGAMVAGFYLVGGVGIGTAFLIAAALNVAVGLAALAASAAPPSGATAGHAPAAHTTPNAVGPGARAVLLAIFTLSGFATFVLEVVWFRVLVHYVHATTYAFTLMLAAVLAGIAAGSYAAAPLIRAGRAGLGLLAAVELALGVASLGSLMLLARSRDVLGVVGAERGLTGGFGLADLAFLALSFGSLLPASLLLGLAFPIGLSLWAAADPTRAARGVGLFYGLNVSGAIAGALIAGFVLVPLIGTQGGLVIAAALSAGSGLALLVVTRGGRRGIAAAAAGTLAFAVTLASLPDPFASALERRYAGDRLLWREEGVQSTVTVHQRSDGLRVLYLDGIHQADDHPELVMLQRRIGHVPMVLHGEARRVLVVGLGGGGTAGAVARHGRASVEVVELSPSVVRAAQLFEHVNDGVLLRSNVRIRIDDARNHLLLRPGPYDVITSDVIQPHHAGAGNVYSIEYFRLMRDALAEDGVALQWLGHFPETRQKLIMRTFLAAFPEATLWADGSLMVGTKRRLQLEPARIARVIADRELTAALAGIGIRDFDSLLALYAAGPDDLRAYVGDGPLLMDDRPLVEYFLSLPLGEPFADLSRVRGDVRHVLRRRRAFSGSGVRA